MTSKTPGASEQFEQITSAQIVSPPSGGMKPEEMIEHEILTDRWMVVESVFLDNDADPAALNVQQGERSTGNAAWGGSG